MLILPEIERPDRPQPGQLVLSEELRQSVLDYLLARCVLGIGVEVWIPEITWVSVSAELLVAERSHPELIKQVQQRAETDLSRPSRCFKAPGELPRRRATRTRADRYSD